MSYFTWLVLVAARVVLGVEDELVLRLKPLLRQGRDRQTSQRRRQQIMEQKGLVDHERSGIGLRPYWPTCYPGLFTRIL